MAFRNLAPVRALVRELEPLVGSFATTSVKASLDLATKTTHDNTVIQAAQPGGNQITVSMAGTDSSGVHITVRNGTRVFITFQDGVSTVGAVETAIGALAGANAIISVKTPGTGATVLTNAADSFAETALTGGESLAVKGLGFTVAHDLTTAGVFVVTLTKKPYEVDAAVASLQLATPAAQFAEVLAIDTTAKTVKIGIWDKAGAALADVASNANNRINFSLKIRGSSASPAQGA